MARAHEVSTEEMLETARQCFLEHGPGVSTAVIAERLGVAQGTLFKRFGTKRELLLAALTPPEPPWVARLEAGPDDRDLRVQLEELARDVAIWFDRMVPCVAALHASGIPPDCLLAAEDLPRPVRAQRALAGWLSRARAQGRLGDGDPDAMAMALLGGLHLRAFLKHVGGGHFEGGAPADDARALVDVVWRGIAPPKP